MDKKIYIDGLDGMGKSTLLKQLGFKEEEIWHSTNETKHTVEQYEKILKGEEEEYSKIRALDRGFFGHFIINEVINKKFNSNYYGLTPKYKKQLTFTEVLDLMYEAFHYHWKIIILLPDYRWIKYLYRAKNNQPLPEEVWTQIALMWIKIRDFFCIEGVCRRWPIRFHEVDNPIQCRVSLEEFKKLL